MIFNPEIETLAMSKLRKLQNERLVLQIKHAYENVPFYRVQFDSIGLKPSDIKSVGDLHKIPFTKKNDLRDNYPFSMFAVPKEDIIRIHASSGTTGKPTVVGYNRHDIGVFSEVVARSFAAAGGTPGMMLQNAYGYGLFTGGLGVHYGAERLGMAVVPISGGMTDRQIMLLQDFKPEMICCTPSYAQTLGEELTKRGIGLDQINLKYAVLGAEPWTEAIRSQIEKNLGVTATNIYGLSEIIGPGVSQEDFEEKGTGSHIWEDHFYPEIVDKDTGEPVPEGEYGVLVLTALTKQAMPILRYWTNDITNIYYDKSSKRTHVKMGSIKGRSDDMLIIRGVNLFHTQVEEVINNIEYLVPNYQIVVTREGIMDEVQVKVEVEERFGLEASEDRLKELKDKFSKKIKDTVGLSMKVTLLKAGEMPRSDGGKLSRIVDLRVNNQ
jgi:phenylacetate-CoA ligase